MTNTSYKPFDVRIVTVDGHQRFCTVFSFVPEETSDVWDDIVMDKFEKEFWEIVREHHGRVERTGKHTIIKFPEEHNKTMTIASTASDWRAMRNNISDLRRLLGLSKSTFTEGVRRLKNPKHIERTDVVKDILKSHTPTPKRPDAPPAPDIDTGRIYPVNIYGIKVSGGGTSRTISLNQNKTRNGTPVQYSPHAIATYRWFQKNISTEVAEEYLQQIRRSNMPTGMSALETALKEAEEKYNHYKNVIDKADERRKTILHEHDESVASAKQEVYRYEHMVTNLRESLDLATNPNSVPRIRILGKSHKGPRKNWRQLIPEYVAQHDGIVKKDDYYQWMSQQHGTTRGAAYQALIKLVKEHILTIDDHTNRLMLGHKATK